MARQKEKMKPAKEMKVKTIHQTVSFKAAPKEIYSILMSSARHGALTGGRASISTRKGGMYAIMDGWVHGVNVRLLKNKDIVQTWVCADWPNHHASVVHFHFFPMKNGKETKLEFVH
ncbi:MAG: SRPBCC domain-containing protein [Candidatus Iainarchaeum archaeon]|uniref:SRPBCC domain-containing protein n=1 Tax=Candidatus Iainarchaeum sp. TaxID=3101447 RepID=A0A7T9DKP0_9ARCH|nr:MAG: SRPBCC domain-containing protein [Candidatus Diapherotrites archaeon]